MSEALGKVRPRRNLSVHLRAILDDSPAPERNLLRPGRLGRRSLVSLVLGICAIGILTAGLVLQTPTPALHGDGLISLVGLLGAAIVLFVEFVFDPGSIRWVTVFALTLGLCSALITIVQTGGTAVVGCYIAVGIAARRVPRFNALVVTVPIGLAVIALILSSAAEPVFTALWAGVGFTFTFMISRLALVSQEQHARELALISEEKRSLAARSEAAALAERGRIAREMHDVLAHSLSALAVELEGARLLAGSRGADGELVGAIDRAHLHATTGLEEARSAIEALRGDDLPGPERLQAMAESFAAEQRVQCELEISGQVHPLASEANLAIYRTAQEALTNVRKHAEPDRVDLRLSYSADGTRLEVADHRSVNGSGSANGNDSGAGVALGNAGAGYGVSGMRERAELLGGRLDAGPTADGFRVELWLPEASGA